MKYEELEDSLKIDRNALDEELIQHSQLFHTVSESAVLAAAERDQAKEELDSVYASEDKEVRLNWEEVSDGLKMTETTVANAAKSSTAYKEALETYQEKRLHAAQWLALKDAFHQRGYMLRELCGLYMSEYFTKDSVQGGQSKARKAKAETGRKKLAETRRRKATKSED